MREFAMMDIEPHELSHYFVEMKALLNDCRFNNCMHIEEPGCAIKAARKAGKFKGAY
jgi:ribosome biogenesis GTPase